MHANMADTETARQTAVMQSASQAGSSSVTREMPSWICKQCSRRMSRLLSLAAKGGLCEMEGRAG